MLQSIMRFTESSKRIGQYNLMMYNYIIVGNGHIEFEVITGKYSANDDLAVVNGHPYSTALLKLRSGLSVL